mmetsp:Transcript_16146/g.37432  ORF Transcript_16146/g.37432 Transcript_16146/m.37432 type:complete len:245 (-) Transcript_16146:518-1252(-)
MTSWYSSAFSYTMVLITSSSTNASIPLFGSRPLSPGTTPDLVRTGGARSIQRLKPCAKAVPTSGSGVDCRGQNDRISRIQWCSSKQSGLGSNGCSNSPSTVSSTKSLILLTTFLIDFVTPFAINLAKPNNVDGFVDVLFELSSTEFTFKEISSLCLVILPSSSFSVVDFSISAFRASFKSFISRFFLSTAPFSYSTPSFAILCSSVSLMMMPAKSSNSKLKIFNVGSCKSIASRSTVGTNGAAK